MQHPPTEEQTAIINYVRAGQGSLVIDALAGTGKSWTLLAALQGIPQQSILIAAFNKDIVSELQVKLPKMPRTHGVHVKTFHGLGLGVLKKHFPHVEISKNGSEDLINLVAGAGISFKMRRACVRLLQITKETYAEPTPPASDALLALGYEYNVFTAKMGEREIGLTVEVVRDAYVVSLNMKQRECIDFCDMVWAPVALDLAPPSRYLAVIIDELQDISGPQLALLRKMMLPGKSRFIAAGDVHQQIYGWRGSLGRQVWTIAEDEFKAQFMPLTMTWRCSKAVVRAANEIVPTLRPAPHAVDGSEATYKLGELPFRLANSRSDGIHTFILSRNNADLVDAALFLWRERVAFRLNTGKELLAPIFDLLSHKLDTTNEPKFRKSIDEWFSTEFARAEKANATAYAEKLEEQRAMLLATLKYTAPGGVSRLLNEILLPNQSGILMSTVHKVKGLEAERVFLLKQTFARHQKRVMRFFNGDEDEFVTVTGAFANEEELHLEYVAITRAKEHLVWVETEGIDAKASPTDTFVMSESLEDFTPDELVERLQYVENMASRTKDPDVAQAFMKHARAIETEMEQR